jgi:hypothetical protein
MNTRVAQREGERVGLEATLSSEAAAHAQVETVKQLQLDLLRTAEELALESEEYT